MDKKLDSISKTREKHCKRCWQVCGVGTLLEDLWDCCNPNDCPCHSSEKKFDTIIFGQDNKDWKSGKISYAPIPQQTEGKMFGTHIREAVSTLTNQHDEFSNTTPPPTEEWIERFFRLYKDGRVFNKVPQNYIDYFEARSFIASELNRVREEERGKVREMCEGVKKSYPPNIKQEILGGENGFPNTKIESPDILGIRYVDGYNSALDDVIRSLQQVERKNQ